LRVTQLDISGFRGFAGQVHINLDADAVVVVGANGLGKTSLLDAVLWGLTGRIPRLGSDPKSVVSKYADSGEARVALTLRSDETEEFEVVRSFDGEMMRVTTRQRDAAQGPAADAALIERLWPTAATAGSPMDALAELLTRTVYLQQDVIRDFVENTTEQERFSAVSELVGAGRVTDLQVQLERSKTAWTRATNSRDDDGAPLRQKLTTLQQQLEHLQTSVSVEPSVSPEEWAAWWEAAEKVGSAVDSPPGPSTPSANEALDRMLRSLENIRATTERKRRSLRDLVDALSRLAERPRPDIRQLQERQSQLKESVEQLGSELTARQAQEAEQRRAQAELADREAQLQALATLALKHLGEVCPVCSQEYDLESTKRRLEQLVQPTDSPSPPEAESSVPQIAKALADQERLLAEATAALRQADAQIKAREQHEADVARLRRELEIDDVELRTGESVSAALSALEGRISAIAELRSSGERMSVAMATVAGQARAVELRKEIEGLKQRLGAIDEEVSEKRATGDLAQTIIDGLREAGNQVVADRLKSIGPILQRIYSRIDPHPAFRTVDLVSTIFRGRGQLATVISDPLHDVATNAPQQVLSSSQLNALAVSIYLTLNLSVPRPPLATTILDDPLQSLDDINLLGLVDLLRRVKDQRQLIVSTHDERFGSLLARKLRPTRPQSRSIVLQLRDWSRTGPSVITEEIQADDPVLRLVAS
jgi:DNA repair exonuclease SbcCD ATPase subunit